MNYVIFVMWHIHEHNITHKRIQPYVLEIEEEKEDHM